MTASEIDRVPRAREPLATAQLLVGASDDPARAGGLLRLPACQGSDHDVVALTGEIDIGTVPHLRSAIHQLLSEGRDKILVDLGGVTFLDGAAIGALITATSDVAHAGGTLQVTHNARCMRLLQITGETRRLNITDDWNPNGD